VNLRYAVTATGLLLLSATCALAQVPANGDFETGGLAGWSASFDPGTSVKAVGNSSSLSGSTVGAEFSTGLPGDGEGDSAVLSQTVTLTTASSISFDYRVLRSDLSDVFTGKLVGEGGEITFFSTTDGPGGWTSVENLALDAGPGTYELVFELTSNGNGKTTRVGLDNVAIVPAPPALLAFAFGAGTTGLMGLRRRGRK
jgi:hypothetical protein